MPPFHFIIKEINPNRPLCHSYRLSNEIEAPNEPSPRGLTPTVIITQCPEWVWPYVHTHTYHFIKYTLHYKYVCIFWGGPFSLSTSRTSLPGDNDGPFEFSSPVNHLLSKLTKVKKKTVTFTWAGILHSFIYLWMKRITIRMKIVSSLDNRNGQDIVPIRQQLLPANYPQQHHHPTLFFCSIWDPHLCPVWT